MISDSNDGNTPEEAGDTASDEAERAAAMARMRTSLETSGSEELRDAHGRYGSYLKQAGLPFEPEELVDEAAGGAGPDRPASDEDTAPSQTVDES